MKVLLLSSESENAMVKAIITRSIEHISTTKTKISVMTYSGKKKAFIAVIIKTKSELAPTE